MHVVCVGGREKERERLVFEEWRVVWSGESVKWREQVQNGGVTWREW